MSDLRKNIFFLFGLNLIFVILSEVLLNSSELVFNSLAEQLTQEQIVEALNFQQKWKWVGYVAIPLFLLIKVSVIAAILDAGCFFFEKEIKYKNLFTIVVKAEFVFILVIVFKTIWFYVFQQDFDLEDLQYFYPLSVLNIVGYEVLQPWFIYPLQVLNLFEIAYWFILAYLLGKALNINAKKGMSIVASSYGIGLLIWVVAIMFFTLNMS